MPGLIFTPERERKAYRLKCAFRTDSGVRGRHLELLTLEAGKRFIADMAKQGWEFRDEHGLTLKGPFVWEDMQDLPPVWKQQGDDNPLHYVQRSTVVEKSPGIYELSLPNGSEKWELYGVFVRPEIPLGTKETA